MAGILNSTTVICIRKNGKTVLASDGQVSLGDMICKTNANKIRKIGVNKTIIVGFAGAVADCLTLISMLDDRIQKYSNDLERGVIELSKEWRSNKHLRDLHAQIIVADSNIMMVVGGNGEVMEAEDCVASVGSGSKYALAAAKALMQFSDLSAEDVVRRSMAIAGDMCVYTNSNISLETL